MQYYNQEQIDSFFEQKFQFLIVEIEGNNLVITLNRPEQKNALHPKMVDELAFAFQYAHNTKSLWTVTIKAKGDVFCAGADLKAMRGDMGEITSTIPKANERILISDLFSQLYKPILVLLHADVYAGGTFFVTGATHVIATRGVKFVLSEVKRGLFPFQVMACLAEVINPKKALRWCISGDSWSVKKAMKNDLIQKIVQDKKELELEAEKWLKAMQFNAPKAIQLGLEAYNKYKTKDNQFEYLMNMLSKSLETKDSVEGIKAFREKRQPIWIGE